MSTNLVNRYELSTGLILNGIRVNGNYLLTESFTLSQNQDINLNPMFVQGGPGHAIGMIGKKIIEGNISFPIRVNENNQLEQAAKDILLCAEQVNLNLSIEAENTLSYPQVTADGTPTLNNTIVVFNPVKVKKLMIKASADGKEIIANAEFIGMIDDFSDIVTPFSDTEQLGRGLTWRDTNAYRISNQLRAINSFEININQQIEAPAFLLSLDQNRNDFASFIASKDLLCVGKYQEIARMGLQKTGFVHGGFMFGETLVFDFGSFKATIPTPLFGMSEQPLTKDLYQRTVTANYSMKPSLPLNAGAIFSFS